MGMNRRSKDNNTDMVARRTHAAYMATFCAAYTAPVPHTRRYLCWPVLLIAIRAHYTYR